MASPRCIIFDFGNVIAFFDHQKAACQLAALGRPFGSLRSLRAGKPLDAQAVYSAIFQSNLEDEYDSGRMTTVAFIERLRVDLDLQASDGDIARAWNDMYTPNPAVLEVIDQIDRRVARLVLGSNTNELHYQWFRPRFAPTLDRFDAEVLSYRVGCRKPDLRFFDACVRACAPVSVAECLYIDDRADFIDAAGKMGIPGIVYRPGVERTMKSIISS
jgi:putative hydrolase of the HAD superfamily